MAAEKPTKDTDTAKESEGGSVGSIDTAEGWVFAYEGGAHILFRNTLPDPRFVKSSLDVANIPQEGQAIASCKKEQTYASDPQKASGCA